MIRAGTPELLSIQEWEPAAEMGMSYSCLSAFRTVNVVANGFLLSVPVILRKTWNNYDNCTIWHPIN